MAKNTVTKMWSGFVILGVMSGGGAVADSKGCRQPCKTLNDCPGQLICVGGNCNDDPQVGTHICSGTGKGGGGAGSGCKPSGYLSGRSGHCNRKHDSDCCRPGKKYPQYRCSPRVVSDGETPATMTINSFAEGGDGGAPSECDDRYHDDGELVVALSTGWYDGGSRCLQKIRITGNGVTVEATVVDECDSVNGCDSDHDFQPPCPNNVVDASPAVWAALGISGSDVGDYQITWSDA